VISAPKTVLVVDDEPAVRWLLQQGLPKHLADYQVATVGNGQEAIDYLNAYPVEVLVTDIVMPVKDGFELLAHVRNRHPNLPVVVLATMAPDAVLRSAPKLGAMHVIQKPAAPEAVARCVLDARADTARGRMAGVPLSTLLQLMQLERKTCSLLVRSGERKGRLHFLSGELVNAYAFELDVEGEEAARHLLALDKVTIDFERSLHNHVRKIHTPLSSLLLEVATQLDERTRDADSVVGVGEHDEAPKPHPAAPATAAVVPPPSLDEAIAGLQRAIGGLRTRTGHTARALGDAAPELARGARAAAAASLGSARVGDDAGLAAAWLAVSELAARLAGAAEALGARATAHD
jgi:CheY-like chemotaxis protein